MFHFARQGYRLLIGAAVILLTSQIAWAQSEVRPPLWEIRAGDATAYLFGTIHVGAADFYPLPESVESAFRNSDTLAIEVDQNNTQEAASAVAIALYTPPDSIENHLEPALLASVQKASAQYGLQFLQLRQMKPYLLMFTLTMLEYGRLGFDPAYGLDAHFSQRARREGKRVVTLESMNQQMSMLDNLSPKLQSAMLQITVDEINSGEVPDLVDEMITAWRTGDTEQLNEVLSAEERKLKPTLAKEFRHHFLTERNAAMAQQIDDMLRDGQRVFVAVGALHMVGKDSIPVLLRKKGYAVNPL
jgi:uncharacterized protein YbaP (TraB family)